MNPKPRKGNNKLREPPIQAPDVVLDERKIKEYKPDLSVKWYEHPRNKRILGAACKLLLVPGSRETRKLINVIRDDPKSNMWQLFMALVMSIIAKFRKK